ncbi:G-protein coupled receptor family C group 6 member A [Polymixia lowei]
MVSVWHGNTSEHDKARLERIVRTASKIIGCDLPSVASLYATRIKRKGEKVMGDPSHPAYSFFKPLPSEEDSIPMGAEAPGDIIIGGIFPIHEAVKKDPDIFSPNQQQCVRFDKAGFTKSLAMINAIETMNKSPILRDVGITLGYRIHDSCADVSTALRVIADFTQQGDCGVGTNTSTYEQPVMAIIGASYSEMSIAIARQLTLQMIPQISYSSTAAILSDKTRFPAFMRTIPNDEHQTAAMVRLLNDNNWNWVGILTTDGDYGRMALDSFVSQASERGICVAFKEIFPGSVNSPDIHSVVRRAVRTIHNNIKVKVIVSFLKPTQMMYLYKELRDQALKAGQKSMKRIWLASDSWSSSSYVTGQVPLEDIGHIVGFTFKHGDLSSFNHYLSMLEAAGHNNTGNNSFLELFYTQLNASRDTQNTRLVSNPMEVLRNNTPADTVFSVEMAVSAIAQAVAHTCRTRDCKRPGTVKPWEVLKALKLHQFMLREKNYKFDDKGDINLGYDVTLWRSEKGIVHVHDVMAEYHPLNNSFTYTSHSSKQALSSTVSRCSDRCGPGESKKTAEGQHTCCYECINCTVGHYSNDTDMDQCLPCDLKTEYSLEGSSSCTPKPLESFSWQDGFAVVLLILAALGILLVLLVGALFLQQRHTPIVKAAGGPLCQVILLSLVGSFISAMLFVGEPSNLQCKARQVLFGLSFTLCVSCVLVKSLKILLAFQFNLGLQELLWRLYQPYVIVGGCVALQVITCICWLVLKSPSYNVNLQPTTRLAECHEGSYVAFGVMLGYIALLALVCFICAFKGRKLPQKYNDAKFITFSMLLYLISWVIFVPVYVTTSGIYVPAVEMVVILISNYGVLTCHFFPKCYMILFKREQNTMSAFEKSIYEYSCKNTGSVSIPETSLSEDTYISQPDIISAPSLFLPTTEPIVHQRSSGVTKFRDSNNWGNICGGLVKQQRNCVRRSTSM